MKCCDSNLWPLDERHLANNEEKYREEDPKLSRLTLLGVVAKEYICKADPWRAESPRVL